MSDADEPGIDERIASLNGEVTDILNYLPLVTRAAYEEGWPLDKLRARRAVYEARLGEIRAELAELRKRQQGGTQAGK